jgi:hypothetical protein
MNTTTRITVDQIKRLWTEGGRIERSGQPDVTQDDLGALASQIDTDDEGMPATADDWQAIADQLNYASEQGVDGATMNMFDADMNPIGPATHAQTLAADGADGGWIWIDRGGAPHGVTDEIRDPEDDTVWLPVTSTGVRRDLRKVCIA